MKNALTNCWLVPWIVLQEAAWGIAGALLLGVLCLPFYGLERL